MAALESADRRAERAARQHLQTTMLLGVDFVPIRHGAYATAHLRMAEQPELVSEVRPLSTASLRQEVSGRRCDVACFRPLTDEELLALTDVESRREALKRLHAVHDASCEHCTLAVRHGPHLRGGELAPAKAGASASGYTRTVFGEGNPAADLMFIGEAPGEEEDRTGRPFVGRAGQKLNEIIRAMTLAREDVYIANVLKSRPPGNRTPLPDEAAKCGVYLREQVRIIRPKVIVTLGGPATKLILGTDVGITRIRGLWGVYRVGDLEVPVMPTFHPAYLLRNYTTETRQKVWSDMQAVMQRLELHQR